MMTKTKPDKLFLLGSGIKDLSRSGLPAIQVRGHPSLVRALREASSAAFWLAASPDAPDNLLTEAMRMRPRHQLGGLLTFHQPRSESIQPLQDFFHPFVWGTNNFRHLPLPEIAEVLSADHRGDLFIGGYADPHHQTINLVRGDLRLLSVPVSIFLPSGTGDKADPFRLNFTDCGNTVKLGDYEAAADAILYEADPQFRSRILAKRRDTEKTFGACLRRLRLLRRLRQCDFENVTAKTIARIESGQTSAPHGHTLATIAKILQVEPSEITKY